jgi:hypothetical protein
MNLFDALFSKPDSFYKVRQLLEAQYMYQEQCELQKWRVCCKSVVAHMNYVHQQRLLNSVRHYVLLPNGMFVHSCLLLFCTHGLRILGSITCYILD